MKMWSALRRAWDQQSEKHPVMSLLLIWVPLLAVLDALVIFLVLKGTR